MKETKKGRPEKFGEKTETISFRVPKKQKAVIKMKCTKLINQLTKKP